MTDVLFQSDYWFASTYSQRVETIQNFIEDDQRILVIIDFNTHTDVRGILNTLNDEGQIPCFVRLILNNSELEVYEYNFTEGVCNKNIYVLHKFNNTATGLIKRLTPILAIFT